MRIILATLASLALSTAGYADISSDTLKKYNAAITAGTDTDTMVETAKALMTEAVANPGDERAVLMAFEAGATLCRLQHCAEAQAAGSFVLSAPATDPAAHPIPEDRALLSALAAWTADDKRSHRKALDKALDQMVALQPNTLSLQAFENRYADDIRKKKYSRAKTSAGQAAEHLSAVADTLPVNYVTAALYAATSSFNSSQAPDARRDIANLQGWLQKRGDTLGGDAPEWVQKREDQAHAWGLAMDAWFASTGKRGVRDAEIDAILASYQTDTPDDASGTSGQDETDTGDTEELPFCAGKLRMNPPLRYPAGLAARGSFGAVIAGLDIEDGQVVNTTIRASVPEERFEARALQTISQWTWDAEDGQNPGTDCRMSRKNIILPLTFQIE